MSVQLNHTIVSCRDQQRSAAFLTGILGLPPATRFGHFLVVKADNDVSLDFAETTGPITSQHYAFLVGETDFDAAFDRIHDQDLPYWADPSRTQRQVINHRDGGRGLYFEDPDGHLLELLTRPYGSGPPLTPLVPVWRREEDRQMTSGPAFLGELRDRLLDQVLGLLKADPVVGGVALIGSLGRGEADNWSDIDLLILIDDQAVAQFADEPAARPWAQADLLSDGRHNSPAGATSVGATHIRSGLPHIVAAKTSLSYNIPRSALDLRHLY